MGSELRSYQEFPNHILVEGLDEWLYNYDTLC